MADPVPVTCSSACTVTVVVTPQPMTPELLQADLALWAVCLGFLATVWGLKALYNLFRNGREDS